MMKNMKKVLVIAMCLAISLIVFYTTFTHVEKDYISFYSDEEEHAKFYGIDYTDTGEIKKLDNAVKAEASMQEYVNSIGNDLCMYLNTKYDENWIFEPVEVYRIDLSFMGTENSRTDGVYLKGTKKIFIDENYKSDIDSESTLVHELIHYLHNANNPDKYWFICEREKICGQYFEESIVDALAYDYVSTKYTEALAKKHFQYTSYKFIRMYSEMLEVAIPDYPKYFMENDVEGLEKRVNLLAGKYIEGNKNEFFQKYVWLLDETQEAVLKLDSERYNNAMTIQTAFLCAITSKEKSEEFEKIANKEDVNVIDVESCMH